jgi:hypothetical protein
MKTKIDLGPTQQRGILGNRNANLRTAIEQVPSPRLEPKPGDTVPVRFTNHLNQPVNLPSTLREPALLCRELYERGLMDRLRDGSAYWLKTLK